MLLHTASGQSQLYHSRNTDALIYTVLDENIEDFLKCLLHCPKIVVIDYISWQRQHFDENCLEIQLVRRVVLLGRSHQ